MCGSSVSEWKDYSEDDPIKLGMEYEFLTPDSNYQLLKPEITTFLKERGYVFDYEHIASSDFRNYYGHEMKTPIHSLTSWKKDFKIVWSGINRVNNSKLCGIHVNVSRNPTTDRVFSLVVSFLKNNVSFFKKLSRRTLFEYTNFNLSPDNYYAVLSCRKLSCYEFRLFHATKENSIIAMETAHLLFSYMSHTFSLDDFKRIAKENVLYRNLSRQLEKLELAA